MAPLTIKAKLSEENRRDVHSDQRLVEPDGGRPACRGCLMGLRRFKVFYCTIQAILGDNTVKMPGIPAYREFSNKGLRGGMEFNSFAKDWSHFCCYDYRMVSSILIDMMRSCRGIFKRPMSLCIINNIYDSFLAVRIKPVQVAYLTLDYSVQSPASRDGKFRCQISWHAGLGKGFCASRLYTLPKVPYIKYLQLLLRTSKYPSADSLRIKTENARLHFSPFH